MSTALQLWLRDSKSVFADLERAHAGMSGAGPKRQIAYAYVIALVAQFQLYCRAVHTETAQAILSEVSNPVVARMLEAALIEGRRLERGNPNASNLGADFGRFDIDLWRAVEKLRGNSLHRRELTALIGWRNAIGHGNVTGRQAENKLIPVEIDLNTCRHWNDTLTETVATIDEVLSVHCEALGLQIRR